MPDTANAVNPFDLIERRLQSIERLLADINAKSDNDSDGENDLVELSEAARLTFYSIDRFYAIHRNILPSIQQGKKRLFSKKDIASYLESKKQQPLKKQRAVKFSAK